MDRVGPLSVRHICVLADVAAGRNFEFIYEREADDLYWMGLLDGDDCGAFVTDDGEAALAFYGAAVWSGLSKELRE